MPTLLINSLYYKYKIDKVLNYKGNKLIKENIFYCI